MADRQYGIRPGTGSNGTPPPLPQPQQRDNRRRRSPLKQSATQLADLQPMAQNSRSQAEPYSRQPTYASRQEPHRHAQPLSPPPPPEHRSLVAQAAAAAPPTHHRSYYPVASSATASDLSTSSPIDSRSQALRDVDNLYSHRIASPSPERDPRLQSPYRDDSPRAFQSGPQRPLSRSTMSPNMAAHGTAAAAATPAMLSRASYYQGDGYDNLDPESIADDPDDVFRDPPPRPRSRINLARPFSAAGPTAASAAASTGSLNAGLMHPSAPRDGSGHYQPVIESQTNLAGNALVEKSRWLQEETEHRRKRKRLFIILGIILLIGIIVGAVVGGIFASRKNSAGSSSGSSSSSSGTSGGSSRSDDLYDIDSDEVKAAMAQQGLHKVFPGMDYTPLNAQYPDCLRNGPDQNNITLDVAVLSQLTPAIRMYGTDCNQTEMVLSAIDRLKMNDTMQVWLGVWLGKNTTTNERQISQMYKILDKYPTSHFAGIVIGNEVLFREDLTILQLGQTLTQVRTNLTAKKISLPVATSDLGDDWTASLAAESDIVMANIHPFFAGVKPDAASGWTWNFWQTRNSQLVPARTGSWPKSIVSEVGWPSEGGNNCGTGTTSCPSGQGAVASVDNMNTFMDGWVCPSLTNGTTYFWFSAFDEPWKAIFNTAQDQWETKWGLMDVDRKLKSGLSIPSCGGKTVSKAY